MFENIKAELFYCLKRKIFDKRTNLCRHDHWGSYNQCSTNLRTLANAYRNSITGTPRPDAIGELTQNLGGFGNIKR